MTAADAFCEAFPATFLAFHRRDGRRTELTNASRAVLQHLAQAGPVSIGEAARHLDRAQSVVSEIVAQLEGHGLLEREPDPDNRRRTLVWLTTAGLERLRADADVLDRRLVARRWPLSTKPPNAGSWTASTPSSPPQPHPGDTTRGRE